MTAPCVSRNVQGETTQQRAEDQKLSREWFAAHPRDSPRPHCTATFVASYKKRKLGHREERGVPKWNRTYVDAHTPRKSAGCRLNLSGNR